jgi:hypothetical protein
MQLVLKTTMSLSNRTFSYQWAHNGKLLDGVTVRNYAVSSILRQQSGR